MLRRPFAIALLAGTVIACSADLGDPAPRDAARADGGATSDVDAGGPGPGDAAIDAAPGDGGRALCPCFVGDGPYCAGRAAAMAAEAGCDLPLLAGHERDLLACSEGVWSVSEACADTCAYTDGSTELDDGCVLPECECFVLSAYCGSGAQAVADERGCRIPLLPEHNDDILYCPEGRWGVRTECRYGCHSAPAGTPDFCVGDSEYLLPFDCDRDVRCSSGNHTSNHSGKDEYAYDFAVPRGTTVRAIRGGTVLRVRNVATPGDGCYDGGGSACANLANTVEVRHDDGTVALYMHLDRGTVSVGARVAQGDVIGRSGTSGWSTGPHLHVQLQRDCGIWWCQSIPLTFGESDRIASGSTVTSANCH